MAENKDSKIDERLEEITGSVRKNERRGKLGRNAALVGAAALTLGGGYGIYSLLPDAARETTVPVSQVDEFPMDQTTFTGLDPVVERPAEIVIDTSQNEAMQRQLDAMRRQLEGMQADREKGLLDKDREREKALELLRSEMEDTLEELVAKHSEAQGEYEDQISKMRMEIDRQRAEADRLRAQHQIELDRLARAAGPDLEEEERLRLEAEQRARLEKLREEQRKLQEERINSSMLAVSGQTKEASAVQERELSDNELFVANASKTVETSTATRIARPEITIVQGTKIQATLETAIDSSLPGPIQAIVANDIHSFDGSNVLIPAGSKLYGEYNSNISLAQRRLQIVWTRIVTPDYRSISLAAYGTDALGRSGTTGRVDNHFLTKFGSAALISLIAAAPKVAAAQSNDDLASDTLENIGSDLSDATGNAIEEYLKLSPTITVAQGSAIAVVVDRDLIIP